MFDRHQYKYRDRVGPTQYRKTQARRKELKGETYDHTSRLTLFSQRGWQIILLQQRKPSRKKKEPGSRNRPAKPEVNSRAARKFSDCTSNRTESTAREPPSRLSGRTWMPSQCR